MGNNNINTISNVVEVPSTMDFFEHRYYRLNKILLELLGLWPYQSKRVRIISVVVLFFVVVSVIVPQVIAIMKHLGDRDFIMECAIPLMVEGVFFTRLFTAGYNSHKMLKLLNRMRSDWEVWSQDRDIVILHGYAEEGRKMTKMFTVLTLGSFTIFLTEPVIPKIIDVLLMNGTKPGHFPLLLDYYYIDMQQYYFYIIIHIYVCSYGFNILESAYDTLVMVYVQHACGLFAILRHKLEQLELQVSTESGRIVHGSNRPDTAVKYLAWFIGKHNDAIEYAELIAATYSWFFFFIGLFNIILLSTLGIQAFERSNEPQILIKFVTSIMMTMVHVYIENYIGQILIDHSISIRSSILQGNWYMLPLKAQKLIPMIMMRSNVPCRLSASKLAFMSMETFGAILKTSLSYFTLLRSV